MLPRLGQVTLKRSTFSPVPSSNKKPRRKIASLPSGAEDDNMFRGTFIPTYERWVGTQANPWVIPDDVAIKTLQAIWDAIYLAVPWTVKPNDCVFERVRISISFLSRKGGARCPSNSRLLLGCAAPLRMAQLFQKCRRYYVGTFFRKPCDVQ
jgi:hypothetical protein